MDSNPYESPREPAELRPEGDLTGWALAIDTLKLFLAGAVAAIVGVPILFAITMFAYAAIRATGIPIP